MIINAEQIKIKGVSLFKKILETYDEVIVNFRGENKYAIIYFNRYLDLEDYKNKIICRNNNPQVNPQTNTIEYLRTREKKTANYEKKIDKMAVKMRTHKEIITATELKTKGVSILNDILNIGDTVVINVNGSSRYIALKIEEYKRLLRIEQDFMYQRSISKEEKFEPRFDEDEDINELIKSLIKD